MAECSNIYPNLNVTPLSDEIKDYFVAELKERELMSKKYLANILLLLSILISH